MNETLALQDCHVRNRMVGYLGSRKAERRVLREEVLPVFTALGSTVIIGGMVRDLARAGAQAFRSDVDLVVQPQHYGRFRDRIRSLGGVANRFGGFGLMLGPWRVDVWALQDTWAGTAGHREVYSFKDLLGCTFFDWDAVLFDVQHNRIMCRPDYFSRLSARRLDINLLANPNIEGAAVRTLRRALEWRVRLSRTLADYVQSVCSDAGWERLSSLDAAAFRYPLLARYRRDFVMRRLEERCEDGVADFGVDAFQMKLPFETTRAALGAAD